VSDRPIGFLLLIGIASLLISVLLSLFTGRVRFLIGVNWALKADRRSNPGRYWGFVLANAALAALAVYSLGRIALQFAGLSNT
jgi:hypothetical protein